MSDLFLKDFDSTINIFNDELRIKDNFDIIYSKIKIAEKSSCIYCVDGFVKDEVMNKIQDSFYKLTKETMPKTAEDFKETVVAFVEVDTSSDKEKIIKDILSGVLCLIIDGYDKVILIDCRKYPMRSVEEPEKYRVLRGSRDGFVETLVSNAALIRRRIRSTNLSFKITTVGETSKTDIAICYMNDRVDKKLLKNIVDRINNIKIDSLTMNQESLAECLYKGHWFNPFPKFKYSERPDSASASILEGHIIILVDNSPAAMILPNTIFDIIEEADDYYFPPVTGMYLRLTRTFITFISIFLTPVYLILAKNPQWVPDMLNFINVKENINVPIILQLLILEISIDGLKLAAINTPNTLNTPFSIISALIIGEFAIKSGWFNAEVMLYMAVVAIANFTHESYELGYAIKFMRMIILILSWAFGLWGLAAGTIFLIICVASNKTISGKSYIYPLIPFNGKLLLRRLIRQKLK